MKKRSRLGITRVLFFLSSLCLTIFLVAAPTVMQRMKNSQYLFSDTAEAKLFEHRLQEQEIPFEKPSANVFCVEQEWKDVADLVYQDIWP